MISIIIINYNTFQLTCDCIKSIVSKTTYTDYEIILVDNASRECDPEIFVQLFPYIKLVKSGINGGFAYGNNLGIASSSGDFILLLNSDTIVKDNAIEKSLLYLQQHKKIGVLSCRMVYPDGAVQYTARRFRSISWEILDLFRFILWFFPYRTRSKLMLGKYFRHDEMTDCDWVNGAFFLFPRKILEQMPEHKLDERFFMYGEDQLWCFQIRQIGYKSFFYPEAEIIHISSGSTEYSKQFSLKRIMVKHELKIMEIRKGRGLYYYLFCTVYLSKESIRGFVKFLVFRFTGKIVK